jgi:Rubredoxin-like zinc ribbon domain (DUF35_N)
MVDAKKYPAPVTNPETAAFWDAARQGKFMIKRCTACGEAHYFPRAICPFCFSDKTVGGVFRRSHHLHLQADAEVTDRAPTPSLMSR